MLAWTYCCAGSGAGALVPGSPVMSAELGRAIIPYALPPVILVAIMMGVLAAFRFSGNRPRHDTPRRDNDDVVQRMLQAYEDVANSRLDPDALLHLIAERTRALVRADASVIEIEEGAELVYRAAAGTAEPFVGVRVAIRSSMSGAALQSGELILCADTMLDPRTDKAACKRVGARSMVVAPLRHGNKALGVLKVYSSRATAFDESDAGVLQLWSRLTATALANALRYAEMERETAEQAAEIRTLHDRLANFLDHNPAAVFIKDSNGAFVYVNDAFAKLVGSDTDRLLGESDAAWATPEDVPRRDALDEQVRQSNAPLETRERVTVGDGDHHWLTVRFPLNSENTTFVGGVILDVTAQVRAEEQMRKLAEQLEHRVAERTRELQQLNEQLESFSYSVSHDLRTPLRAIDGYARMLEEDHAKSLDADGIRLLGVIRENTARMSELISDLLAFARVERTAMARTEVDMRTLFTETWNRVAAQYDGRHFEFAIDGEIPSVDGDPALLRQVVSNLLENAAKFTAQRPVAKIRVTASIVDRQAAFTVADNGAGFDMKYAKNLFGVFQRLHSSKEFEGTGVGLALVRRIIQRHGGTISAEGEKGRGAEFHFTLPLAQRDNDA